MKLLAPGGLHTTSIGPPVLQAEGAEALQQLQPLLCCDVPVPPLLDLPPKKKNVDASLTGLQLEVAMTCSPAIAAASSADAQLLPR